MAEESNGSQQEEGADGTVGLVLSGGGARGAYEIGVLSVLARKLSRDEERPRVLVGTSVGALNAAYLAARADKSLTGTLEDAQQDWERLAFSDVIAPLPTTELRRCVRFGLEAVGLPVASVRSLLDTAPLSPTIAELIRFHDIEKNRCRHVIDAAAVVATSYDTGRSVVFHNSDANPPSDDVRAIDYARTKLERQHVRASSAIEAFFPPVEVTQPAGFDGWYGDGGTSLNTPLKPALVLGAQRLIVVGLNPIAASQRTRAKRPADAFDGAAQAVQALLGDQLASDVGTLAKVNDRIAPHRHMYGHRVVNYIFVTPPERFGIGRLASEVYRRYYAGWRGLRRSRDLALLGRALDAGRNPARGELFSYVFFAPEFASALIKQGRQDAKRWLAEQTGHGPWRAGVGPSGPPPSKGRLAAETPATTGPPAP